MISHQLPPAGLTAAPPRASAAGHAAYEGPITADIITMGSELGCPFLASLKRPEFAATEAPGEPQNLTRTCASSAALAAVAGALGMGPAAACCPHTSNKNND